MSAFYHDATERATILWMLPKVNIGRDPSRPALAGFRAAEGPPSSSHTRERLAPTWVDSGIAFAVEPREQLPLPCRVPESSE